MVHNSKCAYFSQIICKIINPWKVGSNLVTSTLCLYDKDMIFQLKKSSLVPRIPSVVPQSSCSRDTNNHIHQCGTMPLSSPYRMPFFQGACLLARWAAGPSPAKTKWLWVCWRPPSGQRQSDQNTKHHLQCISWLTLSKCFLLLHFFSWAEEHIKKELREIKKK